MKLRPFLASLAVIPLLFSGCFHRVQPEKTEAVLTQENAYTFSDGTSVSLWQNEVFGYADSYRLDDGTELLWVEEPIGPENCSVGDLALQNLSQTAQSAISAYYQTQGILYDVEETLQTCYSDYLASREAKVGYGSRMLSQSVSPYSFGETVVCFLTSVHEPIPGTAYHMETRLHAFFDRETGEEISVWDLFRVPQEDAITRILAHGNYNAQTLQEMRAALKPEYIGLSATCLEVDFPYGALPSQEYATGIAIRYQELDGLLHDWAIPPQEETP